MFYSSEDNELGKKRQFALICINRSLSKFGVGRLTVNVSDGLFLTFSYMRKKVAGLVENLLNFE